MALPRPFNSTLCTQNSWKTRASHGLPTWQPSLALLLPHHIHQQKETSTTRVETSSASLFAGYPRGRHRNHDPTGRQAPCSFLLSLTRRRQLRVTHGQRGFSAGVHCNCHFRKQASGIVERRSCPLSVRVANIASEPIPIVRACSTRLREVFIPSRRNGPQLLLSQVASRDAAPHPHHPPKRGSRSIPAVEEPATRVNSRDQAAPHPMPGYLSGCVGAHCWQIEGRRLVVF